MSLVIIPDALKAKLASADSPVELCTADGTRLGFFTPAVPKKYNLDPGISDEEADRRLAAGGGRPLKDILRDLEARG
ncbi:MAG: hypothetical protein ABGY75_18350 [Gemmataceae bacterium]